MAIIRDPEVDNVTYILNILNKYKETKQNKIIRYLTNFYIQIL